MIADSSNQNNVVAPSLSRSLRRITLALLYAGMIPAFFVTLLGLLSKYAWPLELMSHFRVQYAMMLMVCMVGFVVFRMKRSAAVGVLGLAINLATLAPMYFGSSPSPSNVQSDAIPLRVASLNVHTSNHAYGSVIDFLARTDADVVLLLEVNLTWIHELKSLEEQYPFQMLQPRADNFGLALYSKFELTDSQFVTWGGSEVPTVIAEINPPAPRQPFRFIGTHPLPPTSPEYYELRNRQLHEIGEYVVAHLDMPTVVAGDLNISPWSFAFTLLLEKGKLHNSALGFGVQATWPVEPFFLRIPIDHVLHTSDITIIHREVGDDVGSDHFPVVVDFALPN